MKKFKEKDRVNVYGVVWDADDKPRLGPGNKTTGVVVAVRHDYLIVDILPGPYTAGIPGASANMKQCRRLKPKKRREFWIRKHQVHCGRDAIAHPCPV